MNNLITARLQILYQTAVANRSHVNSLELKPAPTPEEQSLQDNMYNALQYIPDFISYLVECCTGSKIHFAEARLAREFISRIEYDLRHAATYIALTGITDLDKILTIDTQIVYKLAKDVYQALKDIPEINPIIKLLHNFPTIGGDT